MALRRVIVDTNGALSEISDSDTINPRHLGTGTIGSDYILNGDGQWVTVSSLNYWTLTAGNVHRATGNVIVGSASSLGSIPLQVIGNSYFSGNVGINNLSPIYPLDVTGNAGISGIIYANGVGNNIRLRANNTSALDGFVGAALDGNIYLANWDGNRGWRIQPSGVINSLGSGAVGIATAVPISQLQVAGNLTVGTGSSAWSTGNVQILQGGSSPINNRLTFGTDGTGWKFAIGKNQGGTVTDFMTFQDNGAVLVNTTSASGPSIFQVNGSIRQTTAVSQIVYATSNGDLRGATAAEITTALGQASGSYIQNQTAALQTAGYRIHTGIYEVRTATYSLDIGLGGVAGGWARAFRIVHNTDSNGTDGGAFGVFAADSTPNYVYMAIPTSGDSIGYNSTKIISLNNAGNVGIGITNPQERLHTYTSTGNSCLIIERATSAQGQLGIQFRTAGNSNWYNFQDTNDITKLNWWNTTLSAVVMSMYNSGIVVIGNQALVGTKRLQVKGGIRVDDISSRLVYANGTGEFVAADNSTILSSIGDNYIKNQNSSAQVANAWINGEYRSNTIVVGGNSAQFPIPLSILASTHATSRRAAINLGNFGQIVSDVNSNGTNHFGLYNALGSWSFFINQSTNNVGIGTTNPIALLQIAERILLKSDGTIQWGATYDSGLLSWDTAKTLILGMSGKSLSFGSNGVVDRIFLNTVGNVGVGTILPLSKLHITGLARIGGEPTFRGDIIIEQSLTVEAGNGGLEFKTDGNVDGYGKRILDVFDGSSNYNLHFQSRGNSASWTSRMVMTNSGNVGVGVNVPTEQMHINGYFKQNQFTSGLVYASGNGAFVKADNSTILSSIGDNYIKNQISAAQTGNAWVSNTLAFGVSLNLNNVGVIYGNANDIYANIRVLSNQSSTLQDGMYINYSSTGTTNAHLRFFANGTNQRMLIRADSGRVGIGTDSPYKLLHVAGDIMVDTTNKIGFNYAVGGGDTNFYNYIEGGGASALNIVGGTWTSNAAVEAIKFTTNSGQVVTILNGGGVGLGTTTPITKLQITAGHGDTTFRMYSSNGANPHTSLSMWASEPNRSWDGVGIGSNIRFYREDGSNEMWAKLHSGLNQSYIRFYAGNIYFSASIAATQTPDVSVAMLLTNIGMLLLGNNSTYNGTSKLQVNGSILQREVFGTTPIPKLLGAIADGTIVAATAASISDLLNATNTGSGDYIRNNIANTATSQAAGFRIGATGFAQAFVGATNVTSGSDVRFKKDIKDVTNIYDRIKDLNLKSYIKFDQHEIGYIAQDVQRIFPQMIVENDGYLYLNYGSIGAVALQLGKETRTEVEKLKERVLLLEAKLEKHGITD